MCKNGKINTMTVNFFIIILSAVSVIVSSNTVSNVRLVGYEEYIISLIRETIREVEGMEWCNLRVNDITMDLKEDVLGIKVMGRVEYTNGFVVSIQWLDIIESSVRQMWIFNRQANTTTVEVRGALQMHDVTLGFDVLATLTNGVERYTATFTHPLLQFDFTVIKDMYLDDINVTVVGTVSRSNNVPSILPNTHHSQTFAALYDWNSTTIGIRGWGTNIFQPIAYNLALAELQFPRICYNCPLT